MTNLGPILVVLACAAAVPAYAQWQPQEGPLKTRWTKEVTPDRVHPEYPRPQMVRPDWQSLNGLWDYAVRPKAEPRPAEFDGRILVPFPIESALSGVMKRVSEDERLWYRRTFEIPESWAGKKVLLHFGAVDWETTVWVNGKQFEPHRGGYDPFTLDITDALQGPGGSAGDPHELVVAVWDPTDAGHQPRGKQVREPKGIWYTPTTGIWQSVWLEPAAESRIDGLVITPDVDQKRFRISVDERYIARTLRGSHVLRVSVTARGREVAQGESDADGTSVEIDVPDARLWSPDDPFLYDLRLRLVWKDGAEERVIDEATSYAGLRKIGLGPDKRGRTRLLLNNSPLFMYGPLDQGFWPDGLYTAPTDEALRYDLEVLKQLGCNLVRKHVKVEPGRWYYWCDKLGLLVWQDMPNGDKTDAPPDYQRTPESARQFELELERMIAALRNHPCIVMWVPFNEGWGQYDTERIVGLVRQWDPTRLANAASGWHETGAGDVHDIHAYPGPASPQPERRRAPVLGEFGGLGLPVAGHTWQAEKNWGYRSFTSPEELTRAYVNLLSTLRLLIGDPGLAAAVYTQTTDVEIEVNGLMTYDRAVIKMDPETVAAANRRLYGPPPRVKVLSPTSEATAHMWRYTTAQPPEDWVYLDFVDRLWPVGEGGFGRPGTPGIVVRTRWETPEIWLRRRFKVADLPVEPHLKVYHDEDCEVFVNGVLVATLKGYTTSYVLVPIKDNEALLIGENIIAVHCRQTTGGQGIDAGIVDVHEPGPQ